MLEVTLSISGYFYRAVITLTVMDMKHTRVVQEFNVKGRTFSLKPLRSHCNCIVRYETLLQFTGKIIN